MATEPTFDLAELFRRVDRQRRATGQSWAALSQQVGVAAATIRRFETAGDAEADGVLALVRWLGAVPEEFVVPRYLGGEPLLATPGGFVRVDLARVAPGSRAQRTTIQRLVSAAQRSGRSVASLTRWTPV